MVGSNALKARSNGLSICHGCPLLARDDGTVTASRLGRYVDVDTSARAAHIYLLALSASRRGSRRLHLRPAGERRLHRGNPALAEGPSLPTECSDGVPGRRSPSGVTSVCGLDCLLSRLLGRSTLCHAEIRRQCCRPLGELVLSSRSLLVVLQQRILLPVTCPALFFHEKKCIASFSCGRGDGFLRRFVL